MTGFQMLLELLPILITTSVVLLPLAYLIPKERRWMKSLSVQDSRPPQRVRTVELAVLGLMAFSLVLHVSMGGLGLTMKPVPAFLWHARGLVCAVIAVVTAAWMWLGARRSVPMATAGLVATTVLGAMVFASAKGLSYERFETEIRKIPVPVIISIQEEIPDVDVVINGVRLGKAPLHTTTDEIEAKGSSDIRQFQHDHTTWKNFGGATYMPVQKISIDRATRVTMDDKGGEKLDVYVQFERRGQPLMISGSLGYSSGSRMFGQIQPARIPFSVITAEWDQAVKTLLTRARLSDYHVSPDWVAVADSYSQLMRRTLQTAIVTEPELETVLSDWAKAHYQFDQSTGKDEAWRLFERIQREADQQGAYSTDSLAGDAVESLVDQLDANRVIAEAARRLRLRIAANNFGYGWGWHNRNGKQHFSNSPYSDADQTAPRDYVLAHVVWRLDQKWDAQQSSIDNAAERKLVPLLMQLGYRAPQIRKLCDILGGSAIDEFHRRGQAHIHSYQPSTDSSKNEYLSGGEFVLRDYWESLNAVGPAGASFRKRQPQSALDLAEVLLRKSHSLTSVPEWTRFLFLEVEGRDPLAKDFWKSFHTRVSTDPGVRGWAVGVQWDYLSRIHPLPPAADFVAAFPTESVKFGDYGNCEQSLTQLPPDLREEVTHECIQVAAKTKAAHKPDSEAWQAANQTEFQLIRYLPTIPTDSAADAAMQYLQPSNPRSQVMTEYLKQASTYGGLTLPVARRLAKSNQSEQRAWVLPQIQLQPNPANRAILSELLHDEDSSVKQAAETVAAELEALRGTPLPYLR